MVNDSSIRWHFRHSANVRDLEPSSFGILGSGFSKTTSLSTLNSCSQGSITVIPVHPWTRPITLAFISWLWYNLLGLERTDHPLTMVLLWAPALHFHPELTCRGVKCQPENLVPIPRKNSSVSFVKLSSSKHGILVRSGPGFVLSCVGKGIILNRDKADHKVNGRDTIPACLADLLGKEKVIIARPVRAKGESKPKRQKPSQRVLIHPTRPKSLSVQVAAKRFPRYCTQAESAQSFVLPVAERNALSLSAKCVVPNLKRINPEKIPENIAVENAWASPLDAKKKSV